MQGDGCEEGNIRIGEVSGSDDTVEADVIVRIPTILTFLNKIVIWKTQTDCQVTGPAVVEIRYIVQ